MSTSRQRLREFLVARSVRHGTFVLASGERSSIYVDCRLTTLHAPAMPWVGRAVLEVLERRGWRPQAVGGLQFGADPVAFATARESLDDTLFPQPLDAFSVRKESKAHGTGRRIEGLACTDGIEVVVLEDVCTTGGSALRAIEAARAAGMRVLGCVCLVERGAGGRERIEAQGCAFEALFTLEELTGPRAATRSGGIA
ncbi:MAG: orotate phosphoribosyltransferase [Planctomycetota bacterium]|nr:MAG: orotate phosphoribosyltransferase [Planctomycetota bacterium]